MLEVIFDTLKDGFRILPFLFVAFFVIELLEHKFYSKSKGIVEKSGKFGPLIGGVLGCFPQCGFSVMATNLYVAGIITLGTLISIYLSTSDEMLPVLIARGSNFREIGLILLIKVFVGIVSGFVIDLFIKKRNNFDIEEFCLEEHCHCERSLFLSSIRHTFNTWLFIVFVSFILNMVMFYGGEAFLAGVFEKNSLLGLFLAGVIGLIPNCAASVVITELYLSGILGLSGVIAGLLTGSGVSLLVLFKSNKNFKENVRILVLLYLIGVLSGLIIELFSWYV